MASNLTDIKSPLVLVRFNGVDKLLSGLNICGLEAHGPVAYQPIYLFATRVQQNTYLWKNFYPFQSAHTEHSRFRKKRKGTSISLSFHFSNRSFGKIPSKVRQHQSISAFIGLNSFQSHWLGVLATPTHRN